MDLFELPEEILEIILSELSTNDLLACSLVSKLWRVGVNLDRVWKRLCRSDEIIEKLNIPYDIGEIVTSGLETLMNIGDEGGLDPLCYWRRVYGTLMKLEKNWKTKMFRRFKLEGSSPVLCLDSDGETAVTGHEDGTVAVWQLAVPSLFQKINGILEFPVKSVKTTSKYIAGVQKNLIFIFTKTDFYNLTDIKSFDFGDENVEQMEKLKMLGNKFGSWYMESLRIDNTNLSNLLYAVVNDQLIAALHNSSFLRLWTLPGSEFSSVMSAFGKVHHIQSEGRDIYVTFRNDVTFLVKMSTKDDFKVILTVPGFKRFVLGERFIVATPEIDDVNFLRRIWVWDKNGEVIGTKTIATSNFDVLIVESSYVAFSDESVIQIWEPLENVILKSFGVGSPVGFLREGFGSTLIVYMASSLHLWDWKTGKRLYRIYTGLEWTGTYKNLTWSNHSMILSAGVRHQLELLSFLYRE